MDHLQVRDHWNGNADAWTELSRAGGDVCRDHCNTPRFLDMLPDVRGLRGLDIGCGEGTNTRRIAARGARMSAIDIADRFLAHAAAVREHDGPAVAYAAASALELPFADATFDFAVSFMMLMDLPHADVALAEAHRVLRPGGFLQFSILHPCFGSLDRKIIRDERGKMSSVQIARYFEVQPGEVERWTFGNTPEHLRGKHEPFVVPRFHHTLSWWLNTLLDVGFKLERMCEPRPTSTGLGKVPSLDDEWRLPLFMQMRVRKR